MRGWWSVLSVGVSAYLGALLGRRMQELVPPPWGGVLSVVAGMTMGVILGVVLIEVVMVRVTGRPMTGEDWRRAGRHLWKSIKGMGRRDG